MNFYTFDPLRDLRWSAYVGHHPNASVFHTPAWLRALQRTYAFEPIVFTTSGPADELKNALVFCVVRSWLTGCRLVSLPFSDHCEPLVDNPDELRALCLSVQQHRAQERWKYVELRPASSEASFEGGFRRAQTFYLHRLDLRPSLDVLLHSFHKDSIQRRIRRAERECLTYEEGRSESLLQTLYHLVGLARRRHQVPLQPLAWFRNLVAGFGENLCIRIASKDGQPAAGILTIAHGKRVVYKYGGSDTRLNHFGAMPLLFWRAIQDAKRVGAEELDLGRSDCDNSGLVVFKDRWSANRSTLTYWRYPGEAQATSFDGWRKRVASRLFARIPDKMGRVVGSLIYRHFG